MRTKPKCQNSEFKLLQWVMGWICQIYITSTQWAIMFITSCGTIQKPYFDNNRSLLKASWQNLCTTEEAKRCRNEQSRRHVIWTSRLVRKLFADCLFSQEKLAFIVGYIQLESLPNMNRFIQSETTKALVRQLTCLLEFQGNTY